MKQLSLENLGVQELDAREMNCVNGGMTLAELIQLCWDATPDGGNATFTPWEGGWDNGFDVHFW